MKRLELLFSNQTVATVAWMLIDALLINLACLLAYWVRYDLQLFRTVDPAFDQPYRVYLPFVALFTGLLVLVYRQQNIYRLRRRISLFDEVYNILNATATGTVILFVIIFIYQSAFYSRLIFVYAGFFTVLLLGISRVIKVSALRSMRRRGIGAKRVVIVGGGEVALTVMRVVVANPECGLNIIGFVDDDPARGETDIGRFKALGKLENLPLTVVEQQIDEVIITLPWQYHDKIVRIMTMCEYLDISTRIVPDMFQMRLSHMQVDEIAGVPMIGLKEMGISGLNHLIKRAIDLTLSLLLILFLSPLAALLALIIKMESPGPVLFKQVRVGKDGRLFTLYKFRSMIVGADDQKAALQSMNEADGPRFKIRNDPRMTRLGRLMRKFSFDEFPQLYNVLVGDMSLVGPRPPIPAEVEQYQDWHKRRLEVAPGLTGLSQISGRSELTFDETALLDIYYIENWSPSLDTKILLQTIPKVIFGSGAY
ncbi:MAG TPA: sugar transferase [Anaerolineae bacterium]|nr:sugar transferase [Anaerolineae bacterium]